MSSVLSGIVALDSQDYKKRLGSVLDMTSDSGSLLLNVRCTAGVSAREKNITTYNLARINMLLHGVKDTEFEIFHGDTLSNDWDIFKSEIPAKKLRFDAVVANPPFSLRWEPGEVTAQNARFKSYVVAPKSAADCAFLLHDFYYLLQEGTMAIILPHVVLFRLHCITSYRPYSLGFSFDIDPKRLTTLWAFILVIIQTRSVVMWRMVANTLSSFWLPSHRSWA